MIIPGKIRELRDLKAWSQADLARQSGVSQPTINALEKERQATSKFLPRIASALGVKVTEIDPTHPVGIIDHQIEIELAGLAFETILPALREDITPEGRRDLVAIFLDLVQMPQDDNSALSRGEQMRRRLIRLLVEMKSQR